METRHFAEIREDKFDLSPILLAAKNCDKDAMQAALDQGYALSWRDHRTHKTLMFALGEELNIKSIRFIQSLFKSHTSLSDAIEGAAFANKSLEDIEKIADLKIHYSHAYSGAAKGKHYRLLDSLREKVKTFGNDYDTMNIHFIVSGAAEANDQQTLWKYTTEYYRDRSNYLLSSQITGAANGGHVEAVEKMLQKHSHWDKDAITESGYSVAYRYAMRGAAIAGNIGLIAKLFLHLDHQDRPIEHPLELISYTIQIAAFNGHYDLVFDLVSRAKLYIGNKVEDSDYRSVFASALRGAISGNRYKLAAKLCSLGAKPEDVVSAIEGMDDKLQIYTRFFKTLNDPRFCYAIAHHQDIQKWNRCNEDLIPVVNKMYGLTPVSQEGRSLYFNNEGLNVWLNIHDRLHYNPSTKTIPCNHDAAIIVAEFVTNGQTKESELRESRYLARVFDGLKAPRKETNPPQTVTEKIRRRILDEIDLYLKSHMIAHSQRAKALYSCVNKLASIESIYLLIKHQILLMNDKPAASTQEKSKSALAELAKTPTRTGNSFFNSFFKTNNSLDFLSRLENCLKIIEEYKCDPAVSKMMSDSDIYDRPTFSNY